MPSSFLSFLILATAFIIEVSIVPYFKVRGVGPDLLLLVVVNYAFIQGSFEGSLTGFFGGLFQDLVSTQALGINAFAKTLVGYLSGLIEKTISGGTLFLLVAITFAASLFNGFIYMGFLFLLGEALPFKGAFFGIILPSGLYNSLLSPLVYLILKKLLQRQEKLSLTNP